MNKTNRYESIRPEWADSRHLQIRFGLSKTTLLRLAEEGKIRTASLREPGTQRGKRLYSIASISDYIEGLAEAEERLS